MRVLVASSGGAGHVTPTLPFAAACREAGHEVLLVGPPGLASVATQHGLPFAAGALPPDTETGPVWAQVPSLSYAESERLVIARIFATANVGAMLPAMREAVRTWRPDVVLREPAEFASAVVADEAGIPHVQVAVGLVEAHEMIMDLAADALEAWSPGLVGRIAPTPYLTFFPPTLDTEPRTPWSPASRFRAPEPVAEPLPDLWPGPADEDRPLVYVTFGSVAATVPWAAPIYEVALAAVAELPVRVLVTTGHGIEAGRHVAPGPHVCVTTWVPQADVLPHASLVVCHGGSGTTLKALAAGVPLVITPLFADQPHNARRVAEVGAGVTVVPRDPDAVAGAVDPTDLHRAITEVLADPGPRAVAGRIAGEMAALPPVADAVAVITGAG